MVTGISPVTTTCYLTQKVACPPTDIYLQPQRFQQTDNQASTHGRNVLRWQKDLHTFENLDLKCYHQ